MIYVKSVLGGFAALVLSYVIFVIWFSTALAKSGTVGFTGIPLFSTRMLFIEIVIFMAGFLMVWFFMRQK